MSFEEDEIDVNLRDLAEETAHELAVQSKELADGVVDELSNADADPCNSFEWSLVYFLIFILSCFIMSIHKWNLLKRRANLSAFDILSLALYCCTIIQSGIMLAQVCGSSYSFNSKSLVISMLSGSSQCTWNLHSEPNWLQTQLLHRLWHQTCHHLPCLLRFLLCLSGQCFGQISNFVSFESSTHSLDLVPLFQPRKP